MSTGLHVLIYSGKSRYQKVSPGGAETSMRLIAEKLAEKGVRVSYLTNGISRIPGLRQRKINGVNVYFFSPVRWPLVKNHLFPQLLDRVIRAQKRWVMARIINRNQVNIVHTFNGFPETYDVLKAKTEYHLPIRLIKRMAGLHWVKQLQTREVSPAVLAHIFSGTDILNFVSSGLETLFHDHCRQFGLSVPKAKCQVLDIGIDLSLHRRRSPRKPNDLFTVVCVARFSQYQKRQDLLLAAAHQLRDRPVRIKFVGIGPLLETYRKKTTDLGLDHMVTFCGYKQGEAYRQILESADLFALPTDYEGHSKALAEAMAMGIPAAVSDVIPLNQQIEHRRTGILVSHAPDKWAQAILELSRSPELLESIAENGYDHIRRHFDADKNINAYIQTFDTLWRQGAEKSS